VSQGIVGKVIADGLISLGAGATLLRKRPDKIKELKKISAEGEKNDFADLDLFEMDMLYKLLGFENIYAI